MEQIKIFIENIKGKSIIDVLIAIGIIIVFYMGSSMFSKFIMKLLKIKGSNKENLKQNEIYKSLKNIFICIGFYIGLLVLSLPENWFNFTTKIIRILMIINLAKVIAELISPDSKIMKKVQNNNKISENKIAVNVISKIIKFLIYIVAGFMIIADLGYDLSGLITGLGLSSVVIALAAQELAENLICGMAIITDKPFKIGDYIKVGTYEGTVQDISFRSTKIKTSESTIITIQNSKIVSEAVVNISKIDQRRVNLDLRVPLDIGAKKLNELLESIKLLLYSNQEVIANTLQVNVSEIAEDSIKIAIVLYLNTIDYSEFLKFKTKANISLIRLLEDKGIELAYPVRKIYVNSETNENKQENV